MHSPTTTGCEIGNGECPYCSSDTLKVYHTSGTCDRVKAVEYWPDGRLKRIEFHDRRVFKVDAVTINETVEAE